MTEPNGAVFGTADPPAPETPEPASEQKPDAKTTPEKKPERGVRPTHLATAVASATTLTGGAALYSTSPVLAAGVLGTGGVAVGAHHVIKRRRAARSAKSGDTAPADAVPASPTRTRRNPFRRQRATSPRGSSGSGAGAPKTSGGSRNPFSRQRGAGSATRSPGKQSPSGAKSPTDVKTPATKKPPFWRRKSTASGTTDGRAKGTGGGRAAGGSKGSSASGGRGEGRRGGGRKNNNSSADKANRRRGRKNNDTDSSPTGKRGRKGNRNWTADPYAQSTPRQASDARKQAKKDRKRAKQSPDASQPTSQKGRRKWTSEPYAQSTPKATPKPAAGSGTATGRPPWARTFAPTTTAPTRPSTATPPDPGIEDAEVVPQPRGHAPDYTPPAALPRSTTARSSTMSAPTDPSTAGTRTSAMTDAEQDLTSAATQLTEQARDIAAAAGRIQHVPALQDRYQELMKEADRTEQTAGNRRGAALFAAAVRDRIRSA